MFDESPPLVELFPDPVVEFAPVPATEPQGWPLSPVVPDIDGVVVPVLLLPADEPGVAEGLDPLPLAPALEPELPPLLPPPPPPDWANASPVVPTISAAASTMFGFRIIRLPVCSPIVFNERSRAEVSEFGKNVMRRD